MNNKQTPLHFLESSGKTSCGIKIKLHEGTLTVLDEGLFIDENGLYLFSGGKAKTLDDITCQDCIAELKESRWYCPIHGFIDSSHVTNDEKCDLCGNNV